MTARLLLVLMLVTLAECGPSNEVECRRTCMSKGIVMDRFQCKIFSGVPGEVCWCDCG